MLHTPASRDFSRTLMLSDADLECREKAARVAQELEKRGIRELLECGIAGPFRSTASLDVRYAGQSFELNVPLGMDWRRSFDEAHRREYGEAYASRRAEIVNVRISVAVDSRFRLAPPKLPRRRTRAKRWHGVSVFERDTMPAGMKLRGPAIITELSSCLWLAKGWMLAVKRSGAMVLAR
jgi:N-methylhydantoinase A